MFDNVLDKESKAIYLGNPSIKSVENSTLGGGSGPGHFPLEKKVNKLCLKCLLSHSEPF